MRRRAFLAALVALGLPVPAQGQADARVRRIGVLELGYQNMLAEQWQILVDRLRELGYAEGRNLVIDRRHADGVEARLPQFAKEILAGNPELVLVATTPAVQVMMGLTKTVPIVMTGTADPVGTGLVASLARPGGNVTGVSMQLVEIGTKRLEVLLELQPKIRRLAMLGPAANAGVQQVEKQLREAAHSRGVEVRFFDAKDAPAVANAFTTFAGERIDALFVTQIMFEHHRLIVDLAARHRIPAAYVDKQILDAGGLLVLGPNRDKLYRHAADYAHRILQGAKPTELPVIQPAEFWLGVNQRTARALGLKIPQSVILRADRVIE